MLPNEDFGTLNKRTVVTPHARSTFQGCDAQSFVLPSKIGIYDVHQVLHALEKCFPWAETL